MIISRGITISERAQPNSEQSAQDPRLLIIANKANPGTISPSQAQHLLL